MKILFSVISAKNISALGPHHLYQQGFTDGQDISITFRKLQENLGSAASYYPNFSDWLGRVALEVGLKKRSLILAWAGAALVGINILKHSGESNKLCTYWIHPDFRHKHISSRLLNTSMLFFSEKDPLITIPEFVLGDFFQLIQARNFHSEGSIRDLYQPGVREYFFRIPRLVVSSPLIAQGRQFELASKSCSSEGLKPIQKSLGEVRTR